MHNGIGRKWFFYYPVLSFGLTATDHWLVRTKSCTNTQKENNNKKWRLEKNMLWYKSLFSGFYVQIEDETLHSVIMGRLLRFFASPSTSLNCFHIVVRENYYHIHKTLIC